MEQREYKLYGSYLVMSSPNENVLKLSHRNPSMRMTEQIVGINPLNGFPYFFQVKDTSPVL
jgi:hypothetical protein